MNRQRSFRLSIGVFALILASLPAVVLAGGTAVIESEGKSKQIYWQDDGTLRIGGADASKYMIMRNGKAYSVSMAGGKPRVFEISGMFKMLTSMAKSQSNQGALAKVENVEDTGERKTVAGIEGRVYLLTVTNPDGQTKTKRAVLTDNPLVVEMTRIYMSSMWELLGLENGYEEFMAALPEDHRGLLSSENGFQVKSISEKKPAASLFDLPAKPKSLAEIMNKRSNK